VSIRVISLFAGIGGFDLGFQRAGFEIVAHVEKDANCRKLLASKFPTAITIDDVCTAGAHNLPAHDVLCGGFPCQDLSVAGRRAGLAGARSGLFYQFARIANETQPSFVLFENVPGLLSSDNGRDMCRVLMAFHELGFDGGWRTFDAQYFGLAQRRRRIFGVFARRDIGAASCAEIFSLQKGMSGNPPPRREARKEIAGTLGGSSQSGGCLQERDSNTKNGHLIAVRSSGRGYWTEDEKAATLEARAVHERTLIVYTLRGDGFDASEDGTGRGTPLVVDKRREFMDWLTAPPIAFPKRMSATQCATAEDISPSLQSVNPTAVAFDLRGREGGAQFEGPHDTANIRAASGGSSRGYAAASAVRRLTPRECERLMGFSDDYTAGFSDSTRYRMLGNAVCPPISEWLAHRIRAAMEIIDRRETAA
jgi:DNA (cytosine-5)-methyltransferase 1